MPEANARIVVEVAVDSVAGAAAAEAAGATRIELCSGLLEGGLTPSSGLLHAVRDAIKIPVFAMVRPRGGDFLYDDDEFDVMQRDVRQLRAGGADGIVTGALTADGQLDDARLGRLRDLTAELPITCHRAFDLCADPLAALTRLRQLGIERVLTSGQSAAAPSGAEQIATFVAAAGEAPIVMAGAGVRADNAAELVTRTGCSELHLSATTWRESAMTFRRDNVPMGIPPPPGEYAIRVTDGDMVARVVAALR